MTTITVHTGREINLDHPNNMFMVIGLGYTIVEVNGDIVTGTCAKCNMPYTDKERLCTCK